MYIVDKKGKDNLYAPLVEHYVKMIQTFATVEVVEVFTKEIAKAQDISAIAAQKSYTKALTPYLGSGYNIVFDPNSKLVDSHAFAKQLKDRAEVNLFIGGAYGFEAEFISQCDLALSFGKITLSHKLFKLVVLEQTFRGLAINHNHPYHK